MAGNPNHAANGEFASGPGGTNGQGSEHPNHPANQINKLGGAAKMNWAKAWTEAEDNRRAFGKPDEMYAHDRVAIAKNKLSAQAAARPGAIHTIHGNAVSFGKTKQGHNVVLEATKRIVWGEHRPKGGK